MLNQVSSVKLKYTTSVGQKRFSYDKAGNLDDPQNIYDPQTNQLQETATHTYSYDARGNLKSKTNKESNERTTYTFNDFEQLIEVKRKDTHLRYTYDAFGRRVSKEENSIKHYYLYAPQGHFLAGSGHKENIIAILDSNKQLLASIVHHPSRTDTPLSITNHTTNKTYYYHRNHQGSIVALTNQEGKAVEQMVYDGHYGTIVNHTQTEETLNPYGYTGRETDMHDLYYYRARYYDPSTQRFINLDPIRLASGDFNFYRYVGNDPVNFVDPSGNSPVGGHGAGRTYTGNATSTRAPTTGNLVRDWLTGSGERTQVFGPDSEMTQDLQKDPAIKYFKNQFEKKYCTIGDKKYEPVKFGITDFLFGNTNTLQNIGSYGLSMYRTDKNEITFVISNTMGTKSLLGGLAPNKEEGAMSSIETWFWWKEKSENNCGCP